MKTPGHLFIIALGGDKILKNTVESGPTKDANSPIIIGTNAIPLDIWQTSRQFFRKSTESGHTNVCCAYRFNTTSRGGTAWRKTLSHPPRSRIAWSRFGTRFTVASKNLPNLTLNSSDGLRYTYSCFLTGRESKKLSDSPAATCSSANCDSVAKTCLCCVARSCLKII